MQIHEFTLGALGTNAFLLLAPGRDDAVLVDAPPGAAEAVAPVLEKENRRLAALLLTHGHWDHMAGAADFNSAGVKVYAHPADREWIENPMMQAAFMIPGTVIEPARVDAWLKPGEPLDVGGLKFEVRHVPGHAPGNVVFYHAPSQSAFVGDAIFAGSVGRFDLPGGNGPQLEKSIRTQIYTLPGETVLYPGHGPATTVAEERASNPFVRG